MSAPHKIDPQTLLYAGLGALASEREGDPRHFEELVERGRRAAREQRDKEGGGQDGAHIGSRDLSPDLEVREPTAAGALSLPPFLDQGLPSLLSRLAGGREDSDGTAAVPDLVEAMMPSTVPTAAAVLQARRNSAARIQLIQEVGLLTGAEVAEINQSRAENRSALASRWKGEGLIFSVSHQGRDYFPGFQLDATGKPRDVVARILQALGGAHGWETALWFTAPNAYLDDRRPLDLLESEPDAVVEAARHEGEDVWF